MLSAVIGRMTSANEIIVDEAQRCRKHLLITDQATVKFGLDPVVPPALLAKGGEFQKGCNFNLKDSKVGSAHTRIKIIMIISQLGRVEIVSGFAQINVSTHTRHSPRSL